MFTFLNIFNMRNFFSLILVALLVSSFTLNAQNKSEQQRMSDWGFKKHELRINFVPIFFKGVGLEYEHILSPWYSVGAKANYVSNNSWKEFYGGGYFRIYFTNMQEYGSRGFFAEPLALFGSGNKNLDFVEIEPGFGVGLGVGYKWTNKGGFSFQWNIGVVRGFGSRDFIPDFGLEMGYRF